MKKFLSMFCLLMSFFVTSNVAFSQAPTTGQAVTDCGTGGESKACLAAPAGTLKNSTKTKDFVLFLQWALFLACAIACVIFGLKCASKISDEQWKEAFGPGVGSFLAGAVSYIAWNFIS